MDKKQNLDLVTLVNSQDEVIGEMDKVAAHRGEAKLHRAISVYLFRKQHDQIQLLIQQRSVQKIVGANWWANTCCGNVRPIENYQECALRRLKEELGITQATIQPLHKFEYHLQCNEVFSEWEIDQIFAGWYDDKVIPNLDEVQNYNWVNWNELLNETTQASLQTNQFGTKQVNLRTNQQETPLILAPWFVYMLDQPEIISTINQFLTTHD